MEFLAPPAMVIRFRGRPLQPAAGRCGIRRASVPVQIVEMTPSPGDECEGYYAHLVGGGGDVFLVRPDGCVASRCFGERRAEHPGAWCAKWLAAPKASAPTALATPPPEQRSDNSRHGRRARRAALFVIADARHIVSDALFI